MPVNVKISVSNVDAVISQYDEIAVYRSDTYSGSYSEVTTPSTRPRLVADASIYLFSDSTAGASRDAWYITRYVDSGSGGESDPSEPSKGSMFDINGSIVSVSELRDVYLYGLDLTDDSGNPYPDIMYEWSIAFAADWLEKELDVRLTPTTIEERYDYYRADYANFMSLRLREAPILSVEEVAIQWPSSSGDSILVFPAEWLSVRKDTGQVNIVPSGGSIEQMLIGAAGSFIPLFASGIEYVPDMIRVKYTAGFEAGDVPMVLREIVAKKATFGPLNVAGDLLGGAGIASQSIGIDGLSQSFSTTSSATNAGYGARLIQYSKEIKEQLETLRRFYKGIRMTVA